MKKVFTIVLMITSIWFSSFIKAQAPDSTEGETAIKIALFSLAIGKADVGVEHLLMNGVSLEVRAGYSFENEVMDNPAKGGFAKAGLKFILPFNQSRPKLEGLYLRPEISAGLASQRNGCYDYEAEEYKRSNRFSLAVMMTGGLQGVIRERFLIDLYLGVGSGSSVQMNWGDVEPSNCELRGWQRYFGHSLLSNSFPIALTSGVSMGFVF